ncbi:hypothetical protein ACFVHQ_18605 [Actinomycetes bacterium NPDC127524]
MNYIDTYGNDAIWITASNGASGFGHTSLVIYGYNYKFDKSVYIKGSFQKCLDYAYQVQRKKPYYSVGIRNCLMVSGKVLNKSIKWYNQWKVNNAVAAKSPNWAHILMARYF